MSLPIIFADMPFGFNEIRLGTLKVYAAKLRFKGIRYQPGLPYINVHYHGEYCHISFEVTDKPFADYLYQILGKLARDVAQAKLDKKYGWVNR